MKQSFIVKQRNIISLIAAFLLASGAVGATYKSWYTENINVTFNGVTNKNVTYRVFYTVNGNDSFDGARAAGHTVKSGTTDVKIIIPAQKVARIRLYLGSHPGVVNISKLRINGNKVIKLNDFSDYEYKNMDSTEVMSDGSVTVISDQPNPYIDINKVLNVQRGCDINWLKVVGFFFSVFIIFYAFFMLALYRKKKKKKNFYDYY